MKNIVLIVACCSIWATALHAQSKWYYSYGGEMIFSWANVEDHGQEASSLMRWAPVFNIQSYANRDFSEHLGFYSGLAIRNVGYIYDHYVDPATLTSYKKKFRTYNLAIPVGLKIGNLHKLFFFGGYDIEFPFVYKEKTFSKGDKIGKIVGWFSNRQEAFQHGFHVGVQFPQGLNVKFKYYLSEFHNQDFTESNGVKPYAGLKSNIFYVSLSYQMFTPY